MGLSLVVPDHQPQRSELPPLTPVPDPTTGKPATLTVAGVTLAVCGRDHSKPADFVLARFRPARDATDKREAREAGWTATARTADIARAIKGGLIDVADLIPQAA